MTGRDLRTLFAHAAAGADPRADAELLAVAGDPAAFAALVRRHGPLVWGTCRRMRPDPADAADAFQAVFLALSRSASRVRTPAALGGWLHAAAVRVCLKQRRDAARRRLRETRAARPEATTPVADAAWDAILAAVHEEVERLPHGERTAFVLCELQGVPQAEAAVRLGWKPGTLTGRLSRARAKLLTRLSARGFAPAVGLAGAGVLAVPAEVAALAAGCVGPAADLSPAVVALSREVTQMVATKHLAAAVLVAGGLAAGVGGGLMRADAQGPGGEGRGMPGAPPAKQEAGPGGFPGGLGRPGVPGAPGMMPDGSSDDSEPGDAGRQWPQWQHETVSKPKSFAEFQKLLADRGRGGWEFAGAVTFPNPGHTGAPGAPGLAASETLVFKRMANPPPVERSFTAPPGSRPVPVGGMPGVPGGGGPPEPDRIWQFIGQGQDRIDLNDPANARLKERMQRLGQPVPADGMLTKERFLADYQARTGRRPGAIAPPAAVGGFKVIALTHARAADVARTVRELYPEPQALGGGPQMLGAVRPAQLVVSADDARNLVLFRVGPGLLKEPTEKTVRDLVAELDVPAK